mmetsp:Transcript_5845/g.3326  ORF Transcript_5845/g.3326 Transcript_5845/m.3326 type:complete len:215 (-) Transcript_5845:817-1461(-)
MLSSIVNDIKVFAKSFFKDAKHSHNWNHTLRVVAMCERIGIAEGADLEVIFCSAYLHDIGRKYQDVIYGAICHAEKGAELATPMLEKLPLGEGKKENIIHCIKTHRFRGENTPKTLEAKVLFDADKLDAIGAVGIARAFLFAGEIGAVLHNPYKDVKYCEPYSKNDTGFREFKVKLSKIKSKVLTNEGKKIAEARHSFMEKFFKRFLEEYEGKR